jgi:tetratricopeptide (TPR) repeat protein
LQLRPEDGELYLNLGGIYGQLGRWPEAEEAFKRAAAASPREGLAHRALGVTCAQLGHWQEAAAAFQQAIGLNGEIGMESRDLELEQPQRLEELAANLKEAVRVKPDLTQAHYLLGLVSARLERWQEAALAFSRCLGLDFKETVGSSSYYQKAMEIMSQAVRLQLELAPMRYHQVVVGTGFSSSAARLEALRQAAAANPRDERLHFDLALVYLQLGRYQEATSALKAVVRFNPANALAHYRLALIYCTIGDPGAAVEEYAVLKTLDQRLAEQIFV